MCYCIIRTLVYAGEVRIYETRNGVRMIASLPLADADVYAI